MTTNIYLEKLALHYNISLDFIVFKDELSKLQYKEGLNIIINMSNVGHPGTHWVALHTDKNVCLYFDSFGVEPPVEVISFCNHKKIIFNDYQIQHIESINCGQLSLLFLALTQNVKNSKLHDLLR